MLSNLTKMAGKFRLALVQLSVTASKNDNLSHASQMVKKAAENGSNIVALPECFNSPYGTSYFPEYAEKIPGPSTEVLSKAAKDNKVYVIGGSIPEEEDGKLYNTCTVYSQNGDMIAKHRKMHLFDIDVPGKIRFIESECLSPGNEFTTVETSFCKLGIGICYDIRFQELAQIYAKKGCHVLVYPGAFNMTTGPAHWELLQRARALDNQVFVATVSPARDKNATYVAWGHSTAVNPWGEIIATTEHDETIVYADIDLSLVQQTRAQIPVTSKRRKELYEIIEKK